MLGLAAASARAGRQRLEGLRPPRDHPHRRRARARPLLAGRAAHLRPRRQALPRRLPPARAVRANDDRHRWSRRSASAAAARSRSRPAGAASTGSSPTRTRRRGSRRRTPRTRAPSCRRSSRASACTCAEAEVEAKETKPPPRYTEATLLSAMETAGKLIDDEELREAMKESGLGTPATRAGDDRDADPPRVHRARGQGPDADAEGPPGDHDARGAPAHVARADRRLGEAPDRHRARRRTTAATFIKDIEDFTRATVEQIAALDKEKLRPERVELGPCPRCGAETGEIISENSQAYGCTSWKSREETGCGFVIWKRVAGRTLTPEIARQLLEEGKTKEVVSGFRSRAGKPFRARLVLNEEGKVEFDFPGAHRKPKRPPSRNRESEESRFVHRARHEGAAPPGQSRTIALQCERSRQEPRRKSQEEKLTQNQLQELLGTEPARVAARRRGGARLRRAGRARGVRARARPRRRRGRGADARARDHRPRGA